MLIAVISDTHGNKSIISKIRNELKKRDVKGIIHLGDNIDDIEGLISGFKCKFYGVRGNCDLSSFPEELVVSIGNKRFFITHGHRYGVKTGISNIFYRGKELGVDAVLFGHSHIKIASKEEGMWLINPGSPSIPKDGIPSIAFIEIDNDDIKVSSCTIE